MDEHLDRTMATAAFDPGRFTPRADNYGEELFRWQVRAIHLALAQAGYRIVHEEGGREVQVTLEDGRTGSINVDWMVEAADTVEWRWNRYFNAVDPLAQADALIELSNAMSDLSSHLPGYNRETGEVERPGDE
jgi:hypothetical protein